MKVKILSLVTLCCHHLAFAQTPPQPAATAANQFGIDLHRLLAKEKPDQNLLISPLSIHTALTMTFAGAAGETRKEMAKALHLPNDADMIHAQAAALRVSIDESVKRGEAMVNRLKAYQDQSRIKSPPGTAALTQPPEMRLANRLFGQAGYVFSPEFLGLLRDSYQSPLEALDFKSNPETGRLTINGWVAERTHQKIRNLIPDGAIGTNTALVLANALYFKAPWVPGRQFDKAQLRPFEVSGSKKTEVPTMYSKQEFGFGKFKDYTAVTIPYYGEDFQLLILLPGKMNGLAALESMLDQKRLAECAVLPAREVELFLPKFRLDLPTVGLSSYLNSLGIRKAFDRKERGADFSRMAPNLVAGEERLYIDSVFHQTYLALDEKGTEAAASMAISIGSVSLSFSPAEPPKPIVVRVDHPFLFAIQHRASGACLFLGRVVDPR